MVTFNNVFKEFISGDTQGVRNSVANVGTHRFGLNVFATEERTPHWEMREIRNVIETRPYILSGVQQITRFLVGSEITVQTDDEQTKKFMDEWMGERSDFFNKIENLVFVGVAFGNVYLEPIYRLNNGKSEFYYFEVVPDPSRVYRNLGMQMKREEDFWVFQLPPEVRTVELNGTSVKANFYKINYIQGSYLFRNTVYGIPYSYEHFDHLKIGWSRDGIYGRSFLASTIDNANATAEIIKNIAIIARYRALNTKLITPASEDMELIEDDVVEIEEKLLQKRDEEHLVLNKALNISSLSNTNEYDTMSNELDFLRKDIASGLTPNWATPWANETTHASSGESKIAFKLFLDSLEKTFITFLNKTILDRLRNSGAPIAKDATFKFGEVEMESFDVMVNTGMQLYTQGLISFNEARKMMNMKTLEGGDKFSWEMQTLDGQTIFSVKAKENPKIPVKMMNKKKVVKEEFDEENRYVFEA